MGFALLLLRRIGLAVGAWLFFDYLAYYCGTFGQNVAWAQYATGLAWGAAILAFFLPRPAVSSAAKTSREDQH